MKILWLIPKWTLPATDGARVATDSLIRNTIAAGAEVDVLCLPMPDESTDKNEMLEAWKVKDVMILPRLDSRSIWKRSLLYLKSLVTRPLTPVTFSSFSDQRVRKFIHHQLSQKAYDYIMLDGLHLGVPFLSLPKTSSKLIYRAHNLEVDLWKKSVKEKKNPLMKLFLAYQAAMVDRLEKQIIANSHGIAAIAREDMEEIRKFNPIKSALIPLGLKFQPTSSSTLKNPITFLFIGRLDWAPNRDGLEWLLKEVWPEVARRRPEARLKIVGSGNGSWLKAYAHLPGLKLVGFVKELKEAYVDAHFTVVPIHYGSGTRIKVIESFAMGKRLISTSMGVQGGGLDAADYICAETTQDWIRTLSTVVYNGYHHQLLEESRQKLAARYDERLVGQQFYEWLSTV